MSSAATASPRLGALSAPDQEPSFASGGPFGAFGKSASFKSPLNIQIVSFTREEGGYVNYDIMVAVDASSPMQRSKGELSSIASTSGQTSWTLKKRYREFHSLHQALVSKRYHHNGIPKLPPKKILFIGGDAVQELATDRQKALQSYCNALASVPLLYGDVDFCAFFGIVRGEHETPELMLKSFTKNADKAGWMQKRGEWNTSLKRRWFVMNSGFLYYFESDQSPLCNGMINITECTITSGRNPDDSFDSSSASLTFGIFHPFLREFQMLCETAADCEDWCKFLNLQDAKVKLDDFELLTVIGQGSFGKVVRARKKGTGDLYAMKILKKDKVRESDQVAHTLTERQVLQSVKHPYLVNLKYAFQTEDKLYMVMDYVRGGELYQHLKRCKCFVPERVRLYAAEICLALTHSYLHDMHFVYRDLKPENLLLDDEGHIRLTDFGLAKRMEEGQQTRSYCGTPEYMAPEIILDTGHNFAVDWWCLGILIYEMHVGRTPFVHKDRKQMYHSIIKREAEYPASFPPLAKDLCSKLLCKTYQSRLGSGSGGGRDVQAHPYFRGLDWEALLQRDVAMDKDWIPLIDERDGVQNFDPQWIAQDPRVEQQGGARNLGPRKDEFEGFTFQDAGAALEATHDDDGGLGTISEEASHLGP